MRIERDPAGGMRIVYWMRSVISPNVVVGGRAAEPDNETHLNLADTRVVRGAIPYVVTWCRKCVREYEVPMDWIQETAIATTSGAVLALVTN